ncbi:MAG: cytochrome c [Hyphomicrobiales bacterium]|nr:cytochrome c [Hyphomicrobiales bacterium]
MRVRSVLFGITLAASMSAAVAVALAHGGATGIVRERMDAMTEMARSAKVLAKLFGSNSNDPVVIEEAAGVIQRHAGGALLSLFPEDSIKGPSEASPAIWSDWQEFSALALDLRALATALPDADQTTQKGIFTEIARTCSGCHERFRRTMP